MPPPPTIVLESISDPDGVKTCLPCLMPFHINHSGPAPISTYMHITAAKENVGGPEGESNDAPETGDSASQEHTMDLGSADGENNADDNASLDPTSRPTLLERVKGGATRFVSSFRGRTIQGLNVTLPDGYIGVVLRDAEGNSREAKGGATAMAKGDSKEMKGTKSRRFSKFASRKKEAAVIEISDDDVQSENDYLPLDEEENLRHLSISSTFPSFVLWHPDHPVDEGRDEYARSLKEWTQLAQAIHQTEKGF